MLIYYTITTVLSALISLIYMIIFKKRFNLCFTILQILVPVVCAGALGRSVANNVDEAFFANCVINLAGCFFMPLIFFGILSLCDISVKKWWIVVVISLELLVYVSMMTTKETGWFYKNMNISQELGVTVLTKDSGFMHIAYYALIVALLFLNLCVLVYSLIEKNKSVKKYIIVLSILAFLAIILFLVSRYVLGENQENTLTYVICQAVILYISRDSSYYYLDSYMLDTLGKGNGVGVITFDSRQRLLVCNHKAEEWFPELKELHVGSMVISAEGINPRFSEWFEKFERNGSTTLTEVVKSGDLSIKFDMELRDVDGKLCYCIVLTDDTPQQELLKVLNKNIENVTGTVKKYLDPSLLENLLDERFSHNEGQEFTIAVMFADLRGFTSLTEDIEAKETVQILNKYLTIAERAIHKYNGILDKYVGDEVMAFWIDIKGNGEAARLCAKAALEMKNSMIENEDEVYKDLAKEIFYGIGLNYGTAILGNVGSENRKDYTVIGDTVNVAARVQGIAPKNTIYLTKEFMKQIEDYSDIRIAENRLRVKGKTATLEVYELIDIDVDSESKAKMRSGEMLVPTNQSKTALYICGCRGSYPVSGVRFSQFGGETSCYIIRQNKKAIIIDCGTGFYNAKKLLEDCTEIDVILTHLHYDHCIGLLNWGVFPEGVKPKFFGNFKKWNGENSIHELFRAPFWPVDNSNCELINCANDDSLIKISDGIEARFFDAPHPNESKLVVLYINGKKICVLGDSESYDGIPFKYINGSDFLIYDGMYDDAEYVNHIGWGHSTWQEGVRLAQKTNVGQLIITHHDVSSSDAVLIDREEKARLQFSSTCFARVGDKFEI